MTAREKAQIIKKGIRRMGSPGRVYGFNRRSYLRHHALLLYPFLEGNGNFLKMRQPTKR